jgi:ribonuclease P protein component
VVQEEHREAHVSAQQPSARQAPRLSPSDVDPSGARRAAITTAQGPSQVVGLIWRIRDRRTFLELRRSGRRARAGVLTITFAPDRPGADDPPRLAFSVPRRVGPAVDRNQVRRRIRSAMRRIQIDSPGIVPSGAYLVSVRPEAATRTYEELSIDVETALGKLSKASRAPSGNRPS